MSKVAGRRDDMLVLRGVNVYPSEVERVLLSSPAMCPDYLLVVDERQDARHLIVCCEYRTAGGGDSDSHGSRDPGVGPLPSAGELQSRLRAELGVSVQVRVLPSGTVPRSEVGKAVRVQRWQDGAAPLPGLD
jgi:phenylacetate-CoA ligase